MGPVLALIGHTGAGKSSCLQALGAPCRADMDCVFPPGDPGWAPTLEWLASTDQPTVAVGVHWSLRELAQTKQRGERAAQFARVRFVYLHKPRELLLPHLALPTAAGTPRAAGSQQWPPEDYDKFHQFFVALADHTIDCSGKSVAEVAAEVRALVHGQP